MSLTAGLCLEAAGGIRESTVTYGSTLGLSQSHVYSNNADQIWSLSVEMTIVSITLIICSCSIAYETVIVKWYETVH